MTRMYVFIVLFLLANVTHASDMPEISVNKRINVKAQPRIILGAGLVLKNIDGSQAEEILKLDLGAAPGVGQTIKFKGAVLTRMIRKHVAVLEAKLEQKITLNIPNVVEVYRSKFAFDEAELKAAIVEKYSQICRDCEFQISGLQIPWIADVEPDAKWSLDSTSQTLPRGSFSLPLRIETQGAPKIYWVGGKIQVLRSVPVAARALNIGERLQAGDYQNQKREVTFADDGVTDINALVGKKISRGLRVNDIIWRRDLVKEIAIKQGQAVRIVNETDYYDITLRGVAQEQGEVGDTIRVINPTTQTIIFAVVKEPGVVKVQ